MTFREYLPICDTENVTGNSLKLNMDRQPYDSGHLGASAAGRILKWSTLAFVLRCTITKHAALHLLILQL